MVDLAVRNKLVADNFPLVKYIARDLWERDKLIHRLGQLDDAIQTGVLALIRAAELWDPQGKASFGTYAGIAIRRWIRQAAERSGLISVGQKQLRTMQTGSPAQTLADRRARAAWFCGSLDERISRHKDLYGNTCDWDGLAQAPTEETEDLEHLHESLRTLPSRDRQLLAQVFGLDGQPKKTQREIAAERGVTKQAVNFALHQAYARLRKRIERRLDAEYGAA